LLTTLGSPPFSLAARAQRVGSVTTSRYCLLHGGYSSSPLAESRKWTEAPSGSGLAFARAGKKSRASKISCPSVSMNSKNRIAAFGCEARRATPAPSKRATPGGMTNQPIGAPLLRSCSGLVGIGRERERNFTGDHEVRQQGMTLAHRYAVGGDDVAEQLEALVLTQGAHHRAEPVAVLGLHAELARPAAIEEITVAFRQLVLLDEPGIVGGDENVEA